jgi:ubiquinone/menaquinone biosynthesis C-methylase UbiE
VAHLAAAQVKVPTAEIAVDRADSTSGCPANPAGALRILDGSQERDATQLSTLFGVASREQVNQLTDRGEEPFVSYTGADAAVNWSEELEAVHAEASRTHFLDRWTRRAIIDGIGSVSPGATIADLGCSTGFLLEDLREAHPDAVLVGVDMIAAGLRKAHVAVPEARLLQADVCQLPLEDESIDAVVSANLLEHVPDDRRALREIARVLKPGRPAALVVPAGPRTFDYYDRFLGHERRYGRGELAQKCRDAGLEPLEDRHLASLLYPPFWLVKQRNRRRYNDLRGEALEARVTEDIARTRDSRLGQLTWPVEDRLVRAGVRLPFGIRSFVVARRAV